MSGITAAGQQSSTPADATAIIDDHPAGERYFRHPGDVVRLVLWGLATVVLVLFIELATDTSDGVTTDLGRAAARVPTSVRELALALAQVGAIVVPVAVAIVLIVQTRWRRLLVITVAGLLGAAVILLIDRLVDLSGRAPGAVDDGTWVASVAFPPLAYLGGVVAATTVGKPWLPRSWRRASDVAIAVLALIMAVAGQAGVPGLLLGVAAGMATGCAVLVIVGAPNRRPTPAAVCEALSEARLAPTGLSLVRAEGGRAQRYRAVTSDGRTLFVKVYAQDSRDADVLYRGTRTLLLRSSSEEWDSGSLEADVEHEALLLSMAARSGVRCPEVGALTALSDGSALLALQWIDAPALDEVDAEALDDDVLDAVWREVERLHAGHLAHGSLRTGNILVGPAGPVVTGMGAGRASATDRRLAIDRAELLTSLAAVVGVPRAVSAAARVLGPPDLAAALPYLQPLALSATTRKGASKAQLRELRAAITDATGVEAAPLEQLVRVRPRTLLTVVALTLAFYILLPQLANVDESVQAMRSANWGWLLVAAVMSMLTYAASAIGLSGGVTQPLPFWPNIQAQMASSFVNRVTPANVGGMALNVRFMQKAGIPPAQAVTGVGLNSAAGGVMHFLLLFVFVAWAGQGGGTGFKVPASSKLLVVIAVVLALIGIALATRRGRRLFRTHVLRWLKQSVAGLARLARSPTKLAALLGGSTGVTVAYITALYATVTAFDGGVSFAQVGAVYLGSSIIAAAAPTPGGLGAMEAALVAGLTGVHVDSGVAVAAVLSYRLLTYWLPILPGWLSFRSLDRRNLI